MNPPTNSMRLYRDSWLTSALALTVIGGGAFLMGKYLSPSKELPVVTIPPSETRIAQIGEPSVTPSQKINRDKKNTRETAKQVRMAADTFEQVHDLVVGEYVDPLPSDKTLSQGAVQAMLSSLQDEQSFYLTVPERRVFESEKRGIFRGIGALTAIRSVKNKEGYTELRLYVVAPIPGSPAEKAGLQTGDRITYLDGHYILSANPYLSPSKFPRPVATPKPVDATQLEDSTDVTIRDGIGLLIAQMQLRQEVIGSHMLLVQRGNTSKPLRFSVANGETIAPLPVMRTETIRGKPTAYIRIPAFTNAVQTSISSLMARLAPEQNIVLDLRQNGGAGSLDVTKAVAASLVSGREPFAIEVGPGGKRTALAIANAGPTTHKRRIAILTDAGTAGLAEALVARLADAGATVLGTGRTWGDGRAQTLFPLPDGSAFTLTTGKLLSPRGTLWDRVGLAPGVLVPRGITESELIAEASRSANITHSITVAVTQKKQEAGR